MFNLLPEIEKKRILQEYSVRKIIVFLLFLFVSGIIATVFSIPPHLMSVSKEKEIEGQISAVRGSNIFMEASMLNKQLSDINLKLKALHPQTDLISVEDIFEKVLIRKNSKISIDTLLYRRSIGKEQSTITVGGVASDRESLATFVQNLEGEALFTKVDLPVSNFTKNKNSDFSILISGDF